VFEEVLLYFIQLVCQLTYFDRQVNQIKFTRTSSKRQCVLRGLCWVRLCFLANNIFILPRQQDLAHSLLVFISFGRFFRIFCCVFQQMNRAHLFIEVLCIVDHRNCWCNVVHPIYLSIFDNMMKIYIFYISMCLNEHL